MELHTLIDFCNINIAKEKESASSDSQLSTPLMDSSNIASLEHLASDNIESNETTIVEEKSLPSHDKEPTICAHISATISDGEYDSDNSHLFIPGFGAVLDERLRKLDEMLLNSESVSHKVYILLFIYI